MMRDYVLAFVELRMTFSISIYVMCVKFVQRFEPWGRRCTVSIIIISKTTTKTNKTKQKTKNIYRVFFVWFVFLFSLSHSCTSNIATSESESSPMKTNDLKLSDERVMRLVSAS